MTASTLRFLFAVPFIVICFRRKPRTSDAALEFAKEHVALYPQGALDIALGQVNPEIVDDDISTKLQMVAEQFPTSDPTSVETVGIQTFSSPGTWSANISLQYAYVDQYLLVSLRVEETESGKLVLRA